MKLILSDAERFPRLFCWNGAPQPDVLEAWLRATGLADSLPSDLVELWRVTGGGDVFETETFLGPFGDATLGDDVVGRNEQLRSSGLPPRYLAFHVGLGIDGFDFETRRYLHLSEGFAPGKGLDFETLDGWYERALRDAYAPIYGLGRANDSAVAPMRLSTRAPRSSWVNRS